MVLNVGEKKESNEKPPNNKMLLPSCPSIRKTSVTPSSDEQHSATISTNRRRRVIYFALAFLLLALLVCIAMLGVTISSRHSCMHKLEQCERRMTLESDDVEDRESMENGALSSWNRIADGIKGCFHIQDRTNIRLDVYCLQEQLLENCWRDIKRVISESIRGHHRSHY